MSIRSLDNKRRMVTGDSAASLVEKLREAVTDLRFGSVELTIHEGEVVQIERRERVRLMLPERPGPG